MGNYFKNICFSKRKKKIRVLVHILSSSTKGDSEGKSQADCEGKTQVDSRVEALRSTIPDATGRYWVSQKVWVFPQYLTENLNELFGQPNKQL